MLVGIDASRSTVAQRTGTERYSLHLIRHLLQLRPGWRFRLYFNAPPSPGLIPDLAHCERRVIPFPRLWTHLRLSGEMLTRPPDLLFVPSHVLPLIHPRRSIVTVHDLGYRRYPEAHTAAQRFYLDWSTRYHARAAAHLLADSQATRDDLVRFYGADPARITVVYPGVDPLMCPVREADQIDAVKRKYRIDQAYILYVGTLQPRKNLLRLVEAFHALCPAAHGLQLVLAGKKGWLYEDILAQAQATGAQGRVILTGFVDDADLPALYSGASLFVMPSLYEGFCFPVLEAMACETPVACSGTSSLPEVAGHAALTFDPSNVESIAGAMLCALQDEAVRSRLVLDGRERVRLFTWERCARQTLSVLERVAAG